MNAYESLDGLFAAIKDDLVEKTVAERLWELFDELLQVVIAGIARSGIVDILEFRNSAEYRSRPKLEYIDELSSLFDNHKVDKTISLTLYTRSFVGQV
nr:hypothetical protein [Acididesulfobacillus acetoxydans]